MIDQAGVPASAASHTVDQDLQVRHGLWLLVAIFAGLTLLGSLVPFEFRDFPWERAVGWLRDTAWWRPARMRWGDALNNVLLFLPFGCLLHGALTFRRQTSSWVMMSVIMVLVVTAVQAMLNEFLQHWFPPRIPNPADVQANLLGAGLGILGWQIWATSWERWLSQLARAQLLPRSGLLALSLGLVVWVLWSLMPLEITLHPADLLRKISRGAIVWNPFSSSSWNLVTAQPVVSLVGLLMGVPLGVWTARFARPPEAPIRPWLTATLAAVFLLMMLELLQLLFSTRTAATVDVVLGGMGAAVGSGLARMLADSTLSHATARDRREGRRLALLMALLIYSLFLCHHFWKPLELLRERSQIERKLLGLRRLPFQDLMVDRTAAVVLADSAEKLLLFTFLGLLLRATVDPPDGRRPAASWLWLPFAALACLFVVGIEAAQAVWKHRSPQSTDVCLGWVGVAAGCWLFSLIHPWLARLGIDSGKPLTGSGKA